jgi:hypothetical protein
VEFINKNLIGTKWPGRSVIDTMENRVGDQFFAVMGWLMGYYCNKYFGLYNNALLYLSVGITCYFWSVPILYIFIVQFVLTFVIFLRTKPRYTHIWVRLGFVIIGWLMASFQRNVIQNIEKGVVIPTMEDLLKKSTDHF